MRKKISTVLRRILRQISYRSIQKRLGYPANTKLLIIHADDLGLSDSENTASFEAMDKGMVNSGSIMVPCPNFNEAADYAKSNPKADIGIHLTLTSEWSSFQWKPVLPSNRVSSIINKNGYFFENTKQLSNNANILDVEREFRAQITRAVNFGIKPTHIDSHMYVAFMSNEILKTYISLGKEFNTPTLLTYDLPIRTWFMKNLILVDKLYCAKPKDYAEGLDNYYRRVLLTLKPGFNCILVHPAYDNKEMKNITLNEAAFGADWRQADFDFFTGKECRQIIEGNNIRLITWREIRDKLV